MAGDYCRGNRITGDINADLHHADKRIHTHNKAHRFGWNSNLRHEKGTVDKRGSRNARRTERKDYNRHEQRSHHAARYCYAENFCHKESRNDERNARTVHIDG